MVKRVTPDEIWISTRYYEREVLGYYIYNPKGIPHEEKRILVLPAEVSDCCAETRTHTHRQLPDGYLLFPKVMDFGIEEVEPELGHEEKLGGVYTGDGY
jgi:hypothetical protein